MPEPILISIATALSTKAATTLFDLVKKKFSKDPKAIAELEAASEDKPETITAVAERLEEAGKADPEFAAALRTEYAQHVESGGVLNQISGTSAARSCRPATSRATSTSEVPRLNSAVVSVERWSTVRAERTVLAVVHNTTAATRLAETGFRDRGQLRRRPR
ncbi:hypothetical protein [Amycolatopsis acidicola]|uniref:hypothetical protein n=1 Tax=Amycolatopsis acidicola TaxID=2596893 RepID=UPI001FB63A7B|nr:hypothetical protein [Amycolatopsis acidicola]